MGRQSRSLCRVLGVLIGATTFAPVTPAALAAASGVVVDPGSPAGKEYALPLDQARAASGGRPIIGRSHGAGSAAGIGTAASPLFGQGIKSPPKSAPLSSPGRRPHDGRHAVASATPGDPATPATPGDPATPATTDRGAPASGAVRAPGAAASPLALGASRAGGPSTLEVTAIALAILILGAATGLGARLLSRQARS